MTCEDDFWAALEADRADRLTFGVFADWLDERADPRGPVLRMMGARNRRPYRHEDENGWVWFRWFDPGLSGAPATLTGAQRERLTHTGCVLPHAWYNRLPWQHRRPLNVSSEWTAERDALQAAVAAFLKMDPLAQRHTAARELRRAATVQRKKK